MRPFGPRDSGPPIRRTRVNHLIRITPIRLIGPDNEQIGVVETPDALRRADELGLDLVEIVPDSRPPVCKIMDYGKFKYEESKKQQKSRAASKSQEMKEVRLGRSVKIDPHDVGIRIDQSRRFLVAGHKVMVTQKFKGREIAHRDIGLANLKRFADSLIDICKVEQTPRWMGKQASIILAPDKPKVEAYKRKIAKEKAAKEGISEEAALKAHEEEAKRAAEAHVEPEDDHDDDDDDEHHQDGVAQAPAGAGNAAAAPAKAPAGAPAAAARPKA